MIHTENRIEICAPPNLIFALASDVLRWPQLFSHYRYVRLVAGQEGDPSPLWRRVKMGASRTGVPVSWLSVQELDPQSGRIRYHHIGGVTKGMEVVWSIAPRGDCSLVTIDHDLDPSRWWLRPRIARYIVGQIFVVHIADKTLQGIKRQAEAAAQART